MVDPTTGQVVAEAPALPEDVLYPKERALVELVRREKARDRRVLVFITHTERRDLSPRLCAILEREGFRVAVLKASTVPADRREEWVAARVAEGIDVLVTHPRLVQTGLDLLPFVSICWAEVEYSVYTMRQASRRSWRLGQDRPIEVSYLVYEGTLQAEALGLVAAKLRSALLIEGELPEAGLAALDGDGQDMILALARRLTREGATEAPSLEALFAQTRAHEVAGEDFLVAGDWEGPPASLVSAEQIAARLDAAHLWERVLGDESCLEVPAGDAPIPGTGGRLVSFDELARLVDRPKRRRRPVPDGQLTFFTS